MNQRKELSPKKKREEAATNRILLTFLFALILIVGLMLANRGYRSISTMFATRYILYAVSCVGVLGIVYGILRTRTEKKARVDYSMTVLNGPGIVLLSAILAIYGFVGGQFYLDGISWMYVFVPAVAVLLLIFLLYPRDFFYISVICACGGYLMWYLSGSIGAGGLLRFNPAEWVTRRGIYASILAILALVAAIVVFVRAKRKNGMFEMGKLKLRLLGAGANYLLLFLTVALMALFVVLAMLLGSVFAYYLTFAVFGYLFIAAIYYTVKII
ncbi:hypothetical protein LJC34_02190 [Oscillospiraceae bacterium OttesenSCG-928-G22]|nr:hypothetical protein [Oscillospiraceae bacterium OttesenSCG-928-G22]